MRASLTGCANCPLLRRSGSGPRILRADTAALAALAVLQAILGDGTLRPPHPMMPIGTEADARNQEHRCRHHQRRGGAPITDKRQLVEYLEQGSKPRVGVAHRDRAREVRLPTSATCAPSPTSGRTASARCCAGLQRFGWEPVEENGNVIALTMEGCSITLEPGGQFELSGAPLRHASTRPAPRSDGTCEQVKEVGSELGVGHARHGLQPEMAARRHRRGCPRAATRSCASYMERKGKLGLDMMMRTCTVQANLDFASEADMVKKFRVVAGAAADRDRAVRRIRPSPTASRTAS